MELKEEWLLTGYRKDIAFQVFDQNLFVQTNYIIFRGILFVNFKFLMNSEIERIFTRVLLDIYLLHFLDADIMDRHE